jgi:hypothetical protein
MTQTTMCPTQDEVYSVADIRAEFKAIQSILPKPDELLQVNHSTDVLRERIEAMNKQSAKADAGSVPIPLPRWLRPKDDSKRVEPHNALRVFLENEPREIREQGCSRIVSSTIRMLSCGNLHQQLRLPADVIRDQFNRAFEGIPANFGKAEEVRKSIKHRSLPVPNFFLDPEDPRQFPPHIALLVVLQEAEDESAHMKSAVYDALWSCIALVALLLRLVLEVIGGAGAIWGGSEVFGFRNKNNGHIWCIASIAVGIFCLLRFVVLNAPQEEDEGDILGAAGPWSLRPRRRLRGIFEHPFHFFLRARPAMAVPYQADRTQVDIAV